MVTSWKAQITEGDYSIQFHTDQKDLYKMIEKACQKAKDKSGDNKKRKIGFTDSI